MKLFIGTPVQSSVKIDYHISMIETVSSFELSKFEYHIDHVIGCSLIEDGRNKLISRFLETDCTHLLFIDSDISWSIDDIRLLIKNQHLDIVGGLYPKKQIKQFPIPNEESLGYMDLSMFAPEENLIDLQKPLKVKHLPTGFMMIRRSVFDKFKKQWPDRSYKGCGEDMFLYFSCELVKEENAHYGEDINFCRMAKIIGLQCYAIPAIRLSHVGDIHYRKYLKVNRDS